jgi:hypothetical protein
MAFVGAFDGAFDGDDLLVPCDVGLRVSISHGRPQISVASTVQSGRFGVAAR